MIRQVDVLVALKIQSDGLRSPYEKLGRGIGIDRAQALRAARRLRQAGLLGNDDSIRAKALAEALIYGVKYFIPADLGPIVRGIPTAYAAPPLSEHIAASDDPPPVWPHAEGNVRGQSVSPIYKTAPDAALRDPVLYEYLALLDAIRIGRARESNLAKEQICLRLGVEV
jgi:hypothetical protein